MFSLYKNKTFMSFMLVLLFRSFLEAFSTSTSTAGGGESKYSCRLANRSDIPLITLCNLRSLPENYTPEYYQKHMTNWPYLAVVAENEEQKLIGYALGRTELLGKSKDSDLNGHVASIAVLQNYRGQGVARNMMKMLHSQFKNIYGVKSVSLHCRVSNTAAVNLYLNSYKYKLVGEIKQYYADGEDAWLMQLDNLEEGSLVSSSEGSSGDSPVASSQS